MEYINIIKDEFNSGHFNLSMANIQISEKIDAYAIEEIRTEVRKALDKAYDSGVDHVSCVISTSRGDVIDAIESCGIKLIDTLVTYDFTRGKSVLAPVNHKVEIGDCTESDVDELCALAKTAYRIDRFHKDKSLDNQLCDSYYENWTRNCFNGLADRIIVARVQGRPVGYMPLKIHTESLELRMILSAVSEQYRGLGIFTSMSHECVRYMLVEGTGKADTLLAGTYISNIAVQKAWVRLGYTLNNSKYVFQKSLRSNR